MPGRELDPAERAIGHFGAHHAPGGIVIDDGGHAIGLWQLAAEPSLKAGSYCLTGLPLLLSTVRPLMIQRNCCRWAAWGQARPAPFSSARCRRRRNIPARPARLARLPGYFVRLARDAAGACHALRPCALPLCRTRRSGRQSGWWHCPASVRRCLLVCSRRCSAERLHCCGCRIGQVEVKPSRWSPCQPC